jgi:hypothetical protein
MIIGIDLDNTIISYDDSLKWYVSKEHPELKLTSFTKSYIKATIRSKYGNVEWMRLQGQLYSKGLQYARPFDNVLSALINFHRLGHQLYIVSHKTKFGHFDESKADLRVLALEWLSNQNFLDYEFTGLKEGDVFFCATLDEKIATIERLSCGVFIDDLLNVFHHPLFPISCEKILFQPRVEALVNAEEINIMDNWDKVSTFVASMQCVISK